MKQEEKGVRAMILMSLERQGVFKNLEFNAEETHQLIFDPEESWTPTLLAKVRPFLGRLQPPEDQEEQD